MKIGVIAGIVAFLMWGLMPLYFNLISHVSSGEILGHRVVWSLVFVTLLLCCMKQWGWIKQVRQTPSLLLAALYSAFLLSVNWLTYIWAVTSGYIIEVSLGYYISPLISVLLGLLFLKESFSLAQWGALILAAAGVLYIAIATMTPLWIAIVLALSFGFYGLSKKRTPLGSVEGLFIETLVTVGFALAYLFYLKASGEARFLTVDARTDLLLMGVGLATALPLLLFTYSAKHMSLSLLGFLQYIGPTVQMLVGIFVFNEVFSGPKVLGFSLIWLALVVYSVEGLFKSRVDQVGTVGD